jgi:hypothetical protein
MGWKVVLQYILLVHVLLHWQRGVNGAPRGGREPSDICINHRHKYEATTSAGRETTKYVELGRLMWLAFFFVDGCVCRRLQ